jgi:hypothetical protein
MRELALAAQQLAAELVLQLLDGACQSGLGNVAVLGSASEVEFACYRKEIADMMHFHRGPATSASLQEYIVQSYARGAADAISPNSPDSSRMTAPVRSCHLIRPNPDNP